MSNSEISMQDHNYDLPPERIAQQAAEPRDSAKLLVYQNEHIRDVVFSDLPAFLPKNASLFYNDAKVIPARIFIKKESGTTVEIFLLKPYLTEYFTALNTSSSCKWECLVGNKKKWKEGEKISANISLNNTPVNISLEWHDRENNIVRISWEQQHKFITILEEIGKMPLPPYIKRDAVDNDSSRYQTVYSVTQGSVAAPTAGLHFTENVISNLKTNGIPMHALTLHVSAGTFLPVSVDNAKEHNMHEEIFSIEKTLLHNLKKTGYTIAVGTTSARVLESLYWCAINLRSGKEDPFCIEKLSPYQNPSITLSSTEAIDTLLDYMEKQHLETITGNTSIMIMPGYTFRFVKGLITNFHQPKSTLILLIAAFTGKAWRDIYAHALENNYRFLSYGDSSLLLG